MATVLVGCKLPNGLVLELITPAPLKEGTVPAAPGKRVILKGANSSPIARLANSAIAEYGETRVDKDFWDEWLKRNQNLECVTNGFVFAVDSPAAFASEVKSRAGERTMLEPLNPERSKDGRSVDPRFSRSLEPNTDNGVKPLLAAAR